METDRGPEDQTEGSVRASTTAAPDLVFAIAHEIGNHLGGIRLHAHLLDEELDGRSLADTSVAIDGLAGRSGPLLSLLRPLLSDEWVDSEEGSWRGLFSRVSQQIEDQGTRGVQFEVEVELESGAQTPRFDWLFPLLIALLEATLAEVPRKRGVRVRVGRDDGASTRAKEIVVRIADEGPDEELSATAALRGRPLCLALARELIGRIGGRVEARREADQTCVELYFPDRTRVA